MRGDEPLVSRVSCGCTRLFLNPPLGRLQVYAFGKRRVTHQAGCEIEPFEHEHPPFPVHTESKAQLAQRVRDGKKAVKEAKERKKSTAQTVLGVK